jgi:hypothetical protein
MYILNYYPAIRKSAIISLVGKYMELETIMWREIRQDQKAKYQIF